MLVGMNEWGDVTRWQRHENQLVEALRMTDDNTGHALRWVVSLGGDAFADQRGLVLCDDDGGEHFARPGSWIVRDERGKFSVVPNTIFHIQYDPV